jgi:carbamoyltransferase
MVSTHILGIPSFSRDGAACLVRNGETVATAREERFRRQNGDASFPARAAEYCLRPAGSRQPT